MALSKLPTNAQAVISKCTLCDRNADARFFCTNCDEEMCKQCKTTHLRSRLGHGHNVISIATDKDTSTQDPKINCKVHTQESVQMYCINCEVLVCLTCIVSKHKNHSFDKLADVTDKFKRKISSHVINIKQEIQGMTSNLQSLEANKKGYIKDTDHVVDGINKKLDEWKSQANTIANSLVQQVQDYKHQDLQQIDKQCKQIQELISEKENVLRSYEGMHQSTNLDAIIKCATNIQEPDPSNQVPIYASSPRFDTQDMVDLTEIFHHLKIDKENGQVNKPPFKQQDVKVMQKKSSKAFNTFGESSTIDNTVVAEFKQKERVTFISVTGDNQAWMSEYGDKNVTLVDIGGSVIQKLQLDIQVDDIKATTQGDLFITESLGHEIQRYNTYGKCVTIANMNPLKTQGLCITSDDDLLVCLRTGNYMDDDADDKVVRMTMNGQVKQTIQYDQHKQPLYRYPDSVTENINGDVCVVDYFRSVRVVVVNKDGILRFNYHDTVKSSNTTHEYFGIACDKLGFILISDFDNHRIHQVDIDGQFVQYVLNKQHGINRPRGLDVDAEGKLWIGDNGGSNVKVVKYRA